MPKDKLSAVELKAQPRTLAKQQHIRRLIAETLASRGKGAAKAVGSTYGTHPDECGLYGFAGEQRMACKRHLVVVDTALAIAAAASAV
jgi:hypothetical protein